MTNREAKDRFLKDPRTIDIVDMRCKGYQLHIIAEKHGISKERVRQILLKYYKRSGIEYPHFYGWRKDNEAHNKTEEMH